MISATVVETSVTSNDNCPSQDFSQTDDLTTRSNVTPELKPFTTYKAKTTAYLK